MLIKYPLSTAAPLTLLVPIFALVSGFFMFAETLTLAQIIACALFLIGIGLIVKPAKPKPSLAQAEVLVR